jgi:hypothetical protein
LTEKIDYSKLADRVVMQAIEHTGFDLNEAQVQRLIQNKMIRAQEMIEARKNFPEFHTDY